MKAAACSFSQGNGATARKSSATITVSPIRNSSPPKKKNSSFAKWRTEREVHFHRSRLVQQKMLQGLTHRRGLARFVHLILNFFESARIYYSLELECFPIDFKNEALNATLFPGESTEREKSIDASDLMWAIKMHRVSCISAVGSPSTENGNDPETLSAGEHHEGLFKKICC